MNLVDEVKSGDRLRALVALRDKLARAIDRTTDPKELAALALRLQRVLAEVEAQAGGTIKEQDDLATRRAAKLSAATVP